MPGTLVTEADRGSILRPVVAKIADALRGQPLAASEAVIEAARRILWIHHFTSVPAESVIAMLNAPSDARHAAAEIASAIASAADPLLAVERLLFELWADLHGCVWPDRPCRPG